MNDTVHPLIPCDCANGDECYGDYQPEGVRCRNLEPSDDEPSKEEFDAMTNDRVAAIRDEVRLFVDDQGRYCATINMADYEWLLEYAVSETRQTVAPNVDGRNFYELCQEYRHSKEIPQHPKLPNTVRAFNNLREYIKTGKLPWESYE